MIARRNIKKEIFRVDIELYQNGTYSQSAFRISKCYRGAGTWENKEGKWAGSWRRRNGMRESGKGGRRMRDVKLTF
jgi:hypothetical protein